MTPFSNNPTAWGACVFFATTNAISGRRIPTKITSPSRISRAALTTISSPGLQACLSGITVAIAITQLRTGNSELKTGFPEIDPRATD
jgi:hypothetical protein